MVVEGGVQRSWWVVGGRYRDGSGGGVVVVVVSAWPSCHSLLDTMNNHVVAIKLGAAAAIETRAKHID